MNQSPHHPPPPQPYGPAHPGGGPPPGRPRSKRSVNALILAAAGFVLGILPLVGLLGTVGLYLAIVDLKENRQDERHDLSYVALVLGVLSTLGAAAWALSLALLGTAIASGSCPHVYAFDGETYRLDADLVSGAMYAGVERTDADRLEHLRAVDGEYRLRVANDLDETDFIDQVALRVVDHRPGVEILPTETGELVEVGATLAPTRAVDARGRDVLSELASLDDRFVTGDGSDAVSGGEPREVWTLELPRPASSDVVFVLRGRSSAFAEEAFVRYMAEMGSGTGPLMDWVMREDCACNRELLAEEIERLGLPLWIRVHGSEERVVVAPIGPAVIRSQAVRIRIPEGEGNVTITVEATPRFWELDAVAIATASSEPVSDVSLQPKSALAALRSGDSDVTALLSRVDGERLVLLPGERAELRFEAPPLAHDATRSVLVSLRGYYELPIGGAWGLDPLAILGHQTGLTSLPRFAAKLSPSK